jgi:hypothetical protein
LLSSWRKSENSIHPKAIGEFTKDCCCKYMLGDGLEVVALLLRIYTIHAWLKVRSLRWYLSFTKGALLVHASENGSSGWDLNFQEK